MKYIIITTMFLGAVIHGVAQPYSITGKITDESNMPLKETEILITNYTDSVTLKCFTDKDGFFLMRAVAPGFYHVSAKAHGFENYADSFRVSNNNVDLGHIRLQPIIYMLDEVKITDKILAMVQKDDTLEFNSGAYKVNPDADAADLVRKLPTIDINGTQITAQGESVIKVLVDGRPFFGNDPYASLKNLPADIIYKVQVYNEKSDQEQFTGFSEGNTSKTINIITKADKRNGTFGKIFSGYGSDNNDNGKYGAGATLNQFDGGRRITVTGQTNNVNVQNFTNDNAGTGGSAGTATTNAGGINYADKWGKNMDVSGSYFFNEVNNSMDRQLRRTYLLPADSGQVYNNTAPSANQNYSHRLNMLINYTIDTMNSIMWQPNVSFNKGNSNSQSYGNTAEGATPINQITNANGSKTKGLGFSSNLLLRHKFLKKGRTFSVNVNTNDNNNNGTTLHNAQDVYYNSPALNDTLNQQTVQKQSTWNLASNATYTEPSGRNGLLKLEYNMAYLPAVSDRNTYDYSDAVNTFSVPDSLYSNSFTSRNINHKVGASYMVNTKRAEFSLGLNYQLTELRNEQTLPYQYNLSRSFQNLLPIATLHYKFSKTKNLQCTYNTNTQAPAVSQLQNVINNTDPLHLYTGNPALKQPYRHNLTIRYNATNINAKKSFSASVTGTVTQNFITANSIIATKDSVFPIAIGTFGAQHITLASGSQLTMPENINGYHSLAANISYGMPLELIKCNLKCSLNAGISHVPALINNEVNEQSNKTGGIGITISSNINENVDFIVSSNANVVANANSINKELNTTWFNEASSASLNLIVWKGVVFNTAINYTANAGLAAGYNQNYALWNISAGKKIFKHRQADIRLSLFDVLNQNNNIQQTITDTYVQDTKGNILQRYFLMVFTYKISEFRKG